jgi:hypothetical protein
MQSSGFDTTEIQNNEDGWEQTELGEFKGSESKDDDTDEKKDNDKILGINKQTAYLGFGVAGAGLLTYLIIKS